MQKKPKEENKQLELGLKSPFSNYIRKFTSRISASLTVFELMKYAKDPMVWILNTLSISMLAAQIYMVLENIRILPTLLPLINYYNFDAMKLVGREYVLIVPGVSLLLIVFSLMLSYKWYNREKELVKILLYIQTLSVGVLTYHLLKIVTLF